MEKDSIDILIGIGTVLATIISGYVGLKLKALKSEMHEKHISKDDYKEGLDSQDTKYKEFDDRLRETENMLSVIDDRVKAIFKQMDKQSEHLVLRFDKTDSSIRDSFKDMVAEFDKRDIQYRDMIKDLYKTKKDKE